MYYINSYLCCFDIYLVLLQRGADPSIRNTDGKTALDLADPLSKSVLTGTVMFEVCLNTCCNVLAWDDYGYFLRKQRLSSCFG